MAHTEAYCVGGVSRTGPIMLDTTIVDIWLKQRMYLFTTTGVDSYSKDKSSSLWAGRLFEDIQAIAPSPTTNATSVVGVTKKPLGFSELLVQPSELLLALLLCP